jgi:pimeloyl-ACP methyl ester carboxylesterase
MNTPPLEFVQVNGLRLAYRRAGNPAGKPIILLHGLAENSAYFWNPLLAHFAEQYQLIAFDLLGHGGSDKPMRGYEPDKIARHLADAMQVLQIPQAIIIGHSLGGIIAARFAIEFPAMVEKVVLYGAPLPNGFLRTCLTYLRVTPLYALLPVSMLLLPGAGYIAEKLPLRKLILMVMRLWRAPFDSAMINEELLGSALEVSGIALAECVRNGAVRHRIVGDLERMQCPTLILVGDTDLLVSVAMSQRFQGMIPNSSLTIIENAGHSALLDQPVIFNTAVDKFLSS